MSRTEIRVSGFGGQGVVLLAHILGRACAIEGGRHATMIQSFGPEARGSSCSATLAVCEDEILYPYIRRPDVLVAMSLEAYEKFGGELKDDGTLVYERSLVQPAPKEGQPAYGVPSTRMAEGLGRSIVQNIVMLGFFSAVTRIVERDLMRTAVRNSVPAGTEELNLRAFDAGWSFFEEEYGAGARKEQTDSETDAVAAT